MVTVLPTRASRLMSVLPIKRRTLRRSPVHVRPWTLPNLVTPVVKALLLLVVPVLRVVPVVVTEFTITWLMLGMLHLGRNSRSVIPVLRPRMVLVSVPNAGTRVLAVSPGAGSVATMGVMLLTMTQSMLLWVRCLQKVRSCLLTELLCLLQLAASGGNTTWPPSLSGLIATGRSSPDVGVATDTFSPQVWW